MRELPCRFAVFCLLCASFFHQPAFGQLIVHPGPLDIWIDRDGLTTIVNQTTEAFRFDGYQFISPLGRLDPEGWISFEESLGLDPLGTIATIGFHGFAEANPTVFALGELSASIGATLQPGASWEIGRPFGNPPFFHDAIWEYTNPDGVGDEGPIIRRCVSFCIPEPSSFVLAAVGLVAMFIMARRQRSRQKHETLQRAKP